MLKNIVLASLALGALAVASPAASADPADELVATVTSIVCGTVPPGWYPPDTYVDPTGDIWVNGVKVVDCPPY